MPEHGELKALLSLLMRGRGRVVDPDRPDQVLDERKLRERLVGLLENLPPRVALFADKRAGVAEIIRALEVPYAEARRRAEALPPGRIEAFRRGSAGVPIEELLASPARVDLGPEQDVPTPVAARQTPRVRPKPVLLP